MAPCCQGSELKGCTSVTWLHGYIGYIGYIGYMVTWLHRLHRLHGYIGYMVTSVTWLHRLHGYIGYMVTWLTPLSRSRKAAPSARTPNASRQIAEVRLLSEILQPCNPCNHVTDVTPLTQLTLLTFLAPSLSRITGTHKPAHHLQLLLARDRVPFHELVPLDAQPRRFEQVHLLARLRKRQHRIDQSMRH